MIFHFIDFENKFYMVTGIISINLEKSKLNRMCQHFSSLCSSIGEFEQLWETADFLQSTGELYIM